VLSREQVLDVCAGYAGPDWWVHGSIPQDRLGNARDTWRRPPHGDVIAFADTTVSASGKEGLAVLPEGIVWHSGNASKERWEYTWSELAGVPIRYAGYLLQIGRGALNTAGLGMKRADLADCLRALQQMVIAAGAALAPAFTPDGGPFPASGETFDDAEQLRSLLETLGGDWLYAAPNVPRRKERGAREDMGIPPDESVLALADATIFGSGRDGLVVGTRGIYWRNAIVGGSDNGRMPWETLARVRVMRATDLTILNEEDWVNPPATHGEDVERLLLHLQWWARARMAPAERAEALAAAGEAEPGVRGAAPHPAASAPQTGTTMPNAMWHLAIQGQQYGPYEADMIGIMAMSGQIDPDACHAWTEGMAAWMPLRQVPALAALIGPPPVPAAHAPAASPAPVSARAAPAAMAEEPVDVNNAPLEDLLVLPGMTRARAERVVQERGTRGGFTDVDQLGQVLGLQPHQVQRLRPRVTFGRVAPRARTVDF
jgi:hypothetical protein